jgi:hypothetical protein
MTLPRRAIGRLSIDCVIDNHTSDCSPVFFLFGSVNAVCGRIDREAMDRVLNTEILEHARLQNRRLLRIIKQEKCPARLNFSHCA